MSDKQNDTANQVGSLAECLYATANRVKIAQILLDLNQDELLPTILEDIFVGCQFMLDRFCVKEQK